MKIAAVLKNINRKKLFAIGVGAFVLVFFITLGVLVLAGKIKWLGAESSYSMSNLESQGESDDEASRQLEIIIPISIFAKFKNPLSSVSSEDLKGRDLYVHQEFVSNLTTEEKNSLGKLLGVDLATVKTFSSKDSGGIHKFNDEKYPAEALLVSNLSFADFRLKQLEINGKNVFEDSDYAFKITVHRKYDQITESLAAMELDRSEVKRIFFGGEIIPARAVDRLFLNKYNDYTLLFDRFAEQMKSADLAIAMLENPISGDPAPCTGCTTFVGDEKNAKGFAEVGLDILGFGNHAGDGGHTAIENTEKLLAEYKIAFTGVSSKNLDEAAKLVKKDLAGDFKLGFLAFDDVAWFYWAGESRWGTNRFSVAGRGGAVDHGRIKEVISQAKAQVDFLIVYPSWGIEYTNKNNSHQQELAHALIDNGVDMIVGSHPHWVQNFEVYKDKPIFYSLGNFVFDQTHTTETRQGIVMNAYFYKGRPVNFEIIPHKICGYHQTSNNLASKVMSGEMSYAEVDKTPEAQGCVYWQPKILDQNSTEYDDIWERFIQYTIL